MGRNFFKELKDNEKLWVDRTYDYNGIPKYLRPTGSVIWQPETIKSIDFEDFKFEEHTPFRLREAPVVKCITELINSGIDPKGIGVLNMASPTVPCSGVGSYPIKKIAHNLGKGYSVEGSLGVSTDLPLELMDMQSLYDINGRMLDLERPYIKEIITSDVNLFRQENGRLLPDPTQITVLTAFSERADFLENSEWHEMLYLQVNRLTDILKVFLAYGCKHIILTPFGSDEHNKVPPLMVARAIEKVLDDYGAYFKGITFSNYTDKQEDDAKDLFKWYLDGMLVFQGKYFHVPDDAVLTPLD